MLILGTSKTSPRSKGVVSDSGGGAGQGARVVVNFGDWRWMEISTLEGAGVFYGESCRKDLDILNMARRSKEWMRLGRRGGMGWDG